jgi:hypothetical protein
VARTDQDVEHRAGALIERRPAKPPVRSTLTAVEFDGRLTFEAWRDVGMKIARYATGSAWWLGDWLIFGQERYGRRYKAAIAATGLDYQTLKNYATIARRFEPSRRRSDLSFQHHAEVCGLPDDEQDRWLELAALRRWSRNELRRRLQRTRPAAARTDHGRIALEIERVHIDRWSRAAERSELDLRDWVLQTLDAAAATVDDTSSTLLTRAGTTAPARRG